MTDRPWRVWILAAGLLVPLAALAMFGSGTPTLWSPIPTLSFAAYMLGFGPVAALIPAIAFLAWTPQLRRAEGRVPRRSLVLLAIAVALSAWYLVGSWHYGLKYQGRAYTVAVSVLTAAWFVVLTGLAVLAWRRPSYRRSLGFHLALFAWLAWYALPYLGELP